MMDILDNMGKVSKTYAENTALEKRRQLTTLGKNNKDGTRHEIVLTSQFSRGHYVPSQNPDGPNCSNGRGRNGGSGVTSKSVFINV